MEQTSSSAYPNILVVDYVKKARVASPEILMKAENFLNVGYQKLLTFERPGGGFDWWGNGEPLVWLSAYGLQEFNDMAKVYPIDKGVITRTHAWLMKQMDKDGTWSKIGMTHGESIERMGDPKLLLTSYVVWSLVDSGFKGPELKRSIDFIRAEGFVRCADTECSADYRLHQQPQLSTDGSAIGLALRQKAPAAWLFAWAFLLLPLVYYGVAAHARFRHPLEPLIVVLGVYLFQSAELTKTGRDRKLRKLGT